MKIRRTVVLKDIVFAEGTRLADRPVTRVVACTVIANPFTGRGEEDLSELVEYGALLGEQLTQSAIALLTNPVLSYGKAAIVGLEGELEHAAAILHPKMGRPIRAALGGGKSLIPSTAKVAVAGAPIDVPLGDKDDPWNFAAIDTVTVMIPAAPRPDEIAVVVALADGGRPRPRILKAAAAEVLASKE